MSCSDLEEPLFYETTEPVARKEHPCVECRVPIPRGEKYLCIVAKWSGDLKPSTIRQHIACAEACEAVRDADLIGGCLPFGDLEQFWNGRIVDLNEFSKKESDVADCRRKYATTRRRVRAWLRSQSATAPAKAAA